MRLMILSQTIQLDSTLSTAVGAFMSNIKVGGVASRLRRIEFLT